MNTQSMHTGFLWDLLPCSVQRVPTICKIFTVTFPHGESLKCQVCNGVCRTWKLVKPPGLRPLTVVFHKVRWYQETAETLALKVYNWDSVNCGVLRASGQIEDIAYSLCFPMILNNQTVLHHKG